MCCLYFQVNDVKRVVLISSTLAVNSFFLKQNTASHVPKWTGVQMCALPISSRRRHTRSEKHTSELQSLRDLVCRLLLEKKKLVLKVCVVSASDEMTVRFDKGDVADQVVDNRTPCQYCRATVEVSHCNVVVMM